MLQSSFRVLVCAVFLSTAAARAEEKALTILHFNDFHAAMVPDDAGRGGMANLAGTIRRETKGCQSCVVLFAGDMVQGSPVSTIFRGMPVYDIANRLKIDASTLGNHDFDYGWQQTVKFLRKARYPIVSADIVNDRGELLTRKPYLILKRNGLRIGIIGVMTETLRSLTTPDLRGPWHVAPLIETLRRYAAELRTRTDVIVLLAHLAPSEEDAILQQVPDIPVVITGHLHTGMTSPKQVDGRLLVSVQANARELGRLELKVDTNRKSIVSSGWKRVAIANSPASPAPDVAKQVAKWEKKVEQVVDKPIGEAKRQFAGGELKALIERATVESMGVDFSYMNRGGVRAPLPEGRLLARHVWNTYPFDNRVVVGTFKGKELPKVVTDGKTIDPERDYTLAVNDFTAANQESPSQLGTKGLEFPKAGPLLRDLLIEWIRKKKVLE